MPDWLEALMCFLVIVVFLYFAFLRKPLAPPSGRNHEEDVNKYWRGTGLP
jgi:hypothetical protein